MSALRTISPDSAPDAVVVGAGPNGLAAAVTLARAGLAVEVFEGGETPGGGCRTAALTLPGYAHDVCSTVHPLAAASPFFASFTPAQIPLRLPEVAFAHPLDDGGAAAVFGSVADTAEGFGEDARAYRRLMGPLVEHADQIIPQALGPIRPLPLPPLAMARFGALGIQPARLLAARFHTTAARAAFAGCAAHAIQPLTYPLSGGFGLVMAILAHSVGWPVVEGGSVAITTALVAELERHGGKLHTGHWIESLAELPAARATLLDVTPRQLLALDDGRLPARYRRALGRYRYGPAIFKLDWALSGPVPWIAEPCRATATVHVGGTFEEIARSEADVAGGRVSEQPFCIVVQSTVADPTRAPSGHHTLYAYCHVPNGSTVDMTERIESQIERFAPGFRDLVLARVSSSPAQVEAENPNYVGGDIASGSTSVLQTVFRPTVAVRSYRTPVRGLYLCSAATPPGGGVHGMCGARAAAVALREL
ncbi:MAG TPA: NAD(P)/FAD-dependent oxidoreductase [Solirubrobacteraceae bacterium]|nr:NAD(P)/FAD-dependent oxidoreductase [Solirubrobacteraceae bacterium]